MSQIPNNLRLAVHKGYQTTPYPAWGLTQHLAEKWGCLHCRESIQKILNVAQELEKHYLFDDVVFAVKAKRIEFSGMPDEFKLIAVINSK